MACQAPGLLRRLSTLALLLTLFQPVLTSSPSPPCDQQEGSGCGDTELDGDEEYSGSDPPPQDQGQDHHVHDPSGHSGSAAATLAASSPWCFLVGAAWATAYMSSAW